MRVVRPHSAGRPRLTVQGPWPTAQICSRQRIAGSPGESGPVAAAGPCTVLAHSTRVSVRSVHAFFVRPHLRYFRYPQRLAARVPQSPPPQARLPGGSRTCLGSVLVVVAVDLRDRLARRPSGTNFGRWPTWAGPCSCAAHTLFPLLLLLLRPPHARIPNSSHARLPASLSRTGPIWLTEPRGRLRFILALKSSRNSLPTRQDGDPGPACCLQSQVQSFVDCDAREHLDIGPRRPASTGFLSRQTILRRIAVLSPYIHSPRPSI
mgnify:CR=1 FL=1